MMTKGNAVLLVLALAITVVPLIFSPGAEFGGADDKVAQAVQSIYPDYRPWQESFWEPPSGEIESLLFALQAAAGAGFMGYFFGYFKGRKAQKDDTVGETHAVHRLSGLQ